MHWAWNIVPFAMGASCLDNLHRGDFLGAVLLALFFPIWCWGWASDVKAAKERSHD